MFVFSRKPIRCLEFNEMSEPAGTCIFSDYLPNTIGAKCHGSADCTETVHSVQIFLDMIGTDDVCRL